MALVAFIAGTACEARRCYLEVKSLGGCGSAQVERLLLLQRYATTSATTALCSVTTGR